MEIQDTICFSFDSLNNCYVADNPCRIIDIEVKNDCVVIVTFLDGKKIKTVCNKEDAFDLEYALYLAIAKKEYKHSLTQDGVEWKANELRYYKKYVKIVKAGLKLHKDKTKREAREKKEALEREAARLRRIEKKRERKEAKKQARIDELAQAISLAGKEDRR